MSRFYGIDNKMMVFGTAGVDENGEHFLSKYAKCRADRAAEAYYNASFNRKTGKILLAGGFSKELKDNPPQKSEAQLIGEYMMSAYRIPEEVFLFEEASTTTEENFTMSLAQHPDFFKGIAESDKRLGLVSGPHHLRRVIRLGCQALGWGESRFRVLPTHQSDVQESIIMPVERRGVQAGFLEIAADS